MDPVAHTLTGAALAAAGLRRATPLATAALVLGANAPDVDALAYFAGGYEAFAFRRGYTHGVLALVLWPFVLAGLLLAWDRFVRRRRDSTAAPARAGPLFVLAAIAVVTHPALDWLNNYGLRWLMPFDGRWFYGDALFIIDPWLWLVLGGAVFLAFSNSRAAQVRWSVLALAAALLVVGNPALVPPPSRVLFVAAIALFAVVRRRFGAPSVIVTELTARLALTVAAAYVVVMVGASAAARAAVRTAVAAQGIDAETVMVAPAAADPFAGTVVVVTRDEYYTGRFDWLAEPYLRLDAERLPRPSGAAFVAAAAVPDARKFLRWARFPVVAVEPEAAGGVTVRFADARYLDGARLSGPVVQLDGNGRVVESN